MDPDLVWLSLLVAALAIFAALEIPAIRNRIPGDTLSEVLRKLLRTHTTVGRVVWLVLWLGFAGWLAVHIAWAGSI